MLILTRKHTNNLKKIYNYIFQPIDLRGKKPVQKSSIMANNYLIRNLHQKKVWLKTKKRKE